MDPHRLAEARSRAYHREVARRIGSRPELLTRARQQALRLPDAGGPSSYRRRWLQVLDGSFEELLRVLEGQDADSKALRQCTPFAGALSSQERWRLWKQVRAEQDLTP